MRTARGGLPFAASGSQIVIVSTVGAAQKCVTPDSRMCCQMSFGSSFGRHRCTPPTAVTAQLKHQPLQWNIGSVQRNTESRSTFMCRAIASDCRYAPRWWYITPLGRAVVPLV
jgi:hypothetical protein